MKCPKCHHEWSTATPQGIAARRQNALLGGRPRGVKNKRPEPYTEEAREWWTAQARRWAAICEALEGEGDTDSRRYRYARARVQTCVREAARQ